MNKRKKEKIEIELVDVEGKSIFKNRIECGDEYWVGVDMLESSVKIKSGDGVSQVMKLVQLM